MEVVLVCATNVARHTTSRRRFQGTEVVTHVLQALTSLDENATVVSIDGVGSFDLISRNATVSGLTSMRRSPKEKAASKVIHSCRCHSAWVCTRV